MTLSEFRKTAFPGDCYNCGAQTFVNAYPCSNPIFRGREQHLCFLCATVPGVNAIDYPDQHPHHDIIKPVLGAFSMMLDTLKPPPKPKKPKAAGPVVRPMTRRK